MGKGKAKKKGKKAGGGAGGGGAPKLQKLVETDLESDVVPPKCNCCRVVSKKNYKPHLCPIEPVAKYELYDQLYSKPIPEPGLVREQI